MPQITDAYLDTEFYKRFMRKPRPERIAIVRALQAADTCATEGLDKNVTLPLDPQASEEGEK